MRVYYKDWDGNKHPAVIPDGTCDQCGDDLHYMEADIYRVSVACLTCDFQKWVDIPEPGNGDAKEEA